MILKNEQPFIQCPECTFQSRPYSRNEGSSTRWVCSNFNRHFKTHFSKRQVNNDLGNDTKLKNTKIYDFFKEKSVSSHTLKQTQTFNNCTDF